MKKNTFTCKHSKEIFEEDTMAYVVHVARRQNNIGMLPEKTLSVIVIHPKVCRENNDDFAYFKDTGSYNDWYYSQKNRYRIYFDFDYSERYSITGYERKSFICPHNKKSILIVRI